MNSVEARRALISVLQAAHAGERAAAFAYQGHWRSVRSAEQRADIQRIEADEWRHRHELGIMLAALGARPAFLRECLMAVEGKVISAFCFVSGWFFPMYGAGWIERQNVHEYLDAAGHAEAAGLISEAADLMEMARVEWDHEQYFRGQVTGHALLKIIPLWEPLPTRAGLHPTRPLLTSGTC